MIWGKSVVAGQKMREQPMNDSSKLDDDQANKEDYLPSGMSKEKSGAREGKHRRSGAAQAEKKAESSRREGDLAGALKFALEALELRRDYLRKREKCKRDTSAAKQELARTLVMVARVFASKGDSDKSILHYSEAIHMFLGSGKVKASHSCIQEIKKEMLGLNLILSSE
jgi:hypothetical protein